jgi:hypothetical protein
MSDNCKVPLPKYGREDSTYRAAFCEDGECEEARR